MIEISQKAQEMILKKKVPNNVIPVIFNSDTSDWTSRDSLERLTPTKTSPSGRKKDRSF